VVMLQLLAGMIPGSPRPYGDAVSVA